VPHCVAEEVIVYVRDDGEPVVLTQAPEGIVRVVERGPVAHRVGEAVDLGVGGRELEVVAESTRHPPQHFAVRDVFPCLHVALEPAVESKKLVVVHVHLVRAQDRLQRL